MEHKNVYSIKYIYDKPVTYQFLGWFSKKSDLGLSLNALDVHHITRLDRSSDNNRSKTWYSCSEKLPTFNLQLICTVVPLSTLLKNLSSYFFKLCTCFVKNTDHVMHDVIICKRRHFDCLMFLFNENLAKKWFLSWRKSDLLAVMICSFALLRYDIQTDREFLSENTGLVWSDLTFVVTFE